MPVSVCLLGFRSYLDLRLLPSDSAARFPVCGGGLLYRALPSPTAAGRTAHRAGQAAGQRRRLRTPEHGREDGSPGGQLLDNWRRLRMSEEAGRTQARDGREVKSSGAGRGRGED